MINGIIEVPTKLFCFFGVASDKCNLVHAPILPSLFLTGQAGQENRPRGRVTISIELILELTLEFLLRPIAQRKF